MDLLNHPLDENVLSEALQEVIPIHFNSYNVLFFCIGSDRSTGDSLGPLVGSFLKKKGYTNIIGTLNDNVTAENIALQISKIPTNKHIIVVDSTLSSKQHIGKYFINDSGLKPGAGLGKSLPVVGEYSIAGVVSISGPLAYHILQSTKLSLVISMAENITESIAARFPLSWQKPSMHNGSNWKISC